MKYYAVRKGYDTGIFESWDECKLHVDGYSGAEYKSFSTIEEAKKYLYGNDGEDPSFISSQDKAIAYVDGSYKLETQEYSCGGIIFFGGQETKFFKKFNDPENAKMRNVAGEIKGAAIAMQFCVDHSIPKLDLYYDYQGIEKWCTGVWKAKKEGTKTFKKFYDAIKGDLKVEFIKVKGHSGNKYNDLADKLAKEAFK